MPAKRCPMCHQANEDRAWKCRRCGYEFGQPAATTIELLRGQLRSQYIILVVFAVLEAATVAYLAFGLREFPMPLIVPGGAFVMFMLWTVRAAIKIRISRESIRALSAQQAELPKATLRSG